MSVRNHTPIAYPGSPLHLSVEFCANPPAYAARWLHGDRVYTPGNQYGIDVLAYGVIVRNISSCVHDYIVNKLFQRIWFTNHLHVIPIRIFQYHFVKKPVLPLSICMSECSAPSISLFHHLAAWPRPNFTWISHWSTEPFRIRSMAAKKNCAIPRKYNFQISVVVVVTVIFIVFLNY